MPDLFGGGTSWGVCSPAEQTEAEAEAKAGARAVARGGVPVAREMVGAWLIPPWLIPRIGPRRPADLPIKSIDLLNSGELVCWGLRLDISCILWE
jgi:hypothetical protein